jgi:hypothetical protein
MFHSQNDLTSANVELSQPYAVAAAAAAALLEVLARTNTAFVSKYRY